MLSHETIDRLAVCTENSIKLIRLENKISLDDIFDLLNLNDQVVQIRIGKTNKITKKCKIKTSPLAYRLHETNLESIVSG